MADRELGPVIYDEAGKDTGERFSNDPMFARVFKQGVAGIGETGATIPMLYGLGAAGYDYLTGGKDKTWAESLLTPEGHKAVQDLDLKIVNTLRERYPNEDEKSIFGRLDFIRKHSKEYYDETTPHYRRGISLGRQVSRGMNELVSEDRLPSERTQFDSLIGNAASAAIPLPVPKGMRVAAADFMTTPATTAAGRAGKLAVNAFEVATPFTVPFTPTRYGVNLGVAEAMDQGVRTYTDQPSVLGDVMDMAKDQNGSYDAKKLAIGGLGAVGAALTVWKGKNLLTAPRGSTGFGTPGNVTAAENAPIPNTFALRMRQFGSVTGPIKENMRQVGVPEDVRANVGLTIDREMGAMPLLHAENYIVRGIGRDGTKYGTSLEDTARRFVNMDPAEQEIVGRAHMGSNRIHDAEEALQETSQKLTESQTRLAREMGKTTPDITKIHAYGMEVSGFRRELQARVNDTDPNLRARGTDMSDREAFDAVRLANSNPRTREMLKEFQTHYENMAHEGHRSGIKTASQLNDELGHIRRGLTHHEENPLAGKSWLERKVSVFRGLHDPISVYAGAGPGGTGQLFRGITERVYRRGYLSDLKNATGQKNERPRIPHQTGPVEPRVNTPYDPVQQLMIHIIRNHQVISATIAKREYGKAVLASPKNIASGMKYAEETSRTPGHMIDARRKYIDEELAKDKRHNATIGYYDNGDFVTVRINTPIVKQSLSFMPAATVPILSALRHSIQYTLTGPLRPAFAAVSIPWDISMAATTKQVHMAGGPIASSIMRAAMSGGVSTEHPMIKALTSTTVPFDIFTNMVRALYVAPKRVLIDMLGERTQRAAGEIQKQLAGSPGFYSTMSTMPGMRPLLNNISHILANSYEASNLYQMKALSMGQTRFLTDIQAIERDMEKLGKRMTPTERGMWAGLKSMLSAAHDTGKELAFSTNKKLYEHAARVAHSSVTPEAKADLANAIRIIGGDFQQTSGIRAVAGFLSTVPYGNVALQSIRYLVGRIHKNPIDTATKITMGVTMPVLWGYYNLSNWSPEAADWLWNQQTNDARATTWYIEKPWTWYQRVVLNKDIKFDPQHIIKVRIAPEFLPFTIPTIHALMALGWIGPQNAIKGNKVPLSINKDMKAVMDGLFGLSLPAANIIMAPFGKEFKPSNAFHLESPYKDIRQQSHVMGANEDKMSPGSNIAKSLYDTVGAVYGVSVQQMVAAANVGIETTMRPGGSIASGVGAAAQHEIIQSKASAPFANFLFPDVARRFIYTPVSQTLTEELKTLAVVNKQYANEAAMRSGMTPNTVDQVRNTDTSATSAQLDDPLIRNLVGEIHTRIFSGPLVDLGRKRAVARQVHEAAQIGTAPGKTPAERHAKAQELALEVNRLDDLRYNYYQGVMGDLQRRFGTEFQRKFGTRLTPDSLLAVTQKSATRATLNAPADNPIPPSP